MSCSGNCGFPGWFSGCPAGCTLPVGHARTCACSRDVLQPWGCGASRATFSYGARESGDAWVCPVRLGSFFELLRSIQDLGCLRHAADVWRLGVASVSDLWTVCDRDEFWASRAGFDRLTKPPQSAPLGARSPSLCRQSHPKKDARGCCAVLMSVRQHSPLAATVTRCGKLGLFSLACYTWSCTESLGNVLDGTVPHT